MESGACGMRAMTFCKNEFGCLSNAVLQSCLREKLLATWGIIPLVRRLAQDNAVPAQQVARVELHQCPAENGFINYVLSLQLVDGSCFHEEFQGSSGSGVEHRTYALYDRARDGACSYLHLLH